MRLILCGDLVPTAATRPAFDRGDFSALMGDALSVIRSGDFAVANLECALTDGGRAIRKLGALLKGVPGDARVIAGCGFTHLGLSNNHTLDYGVAGMRDTVRAVEGAGMVPFGFGENDRDSRKPLFLEKDGQRVAVVAVCEHEYTYALRDRFGANPFDPFDTMQDIAEAKKAADFVVVMYHGGKEQSEYPSPRLRKACRAMVRAGADLVLTQHSHCIGCREAYENGEILYGQGNFNFVDDLDNEQWRSGLIVDADFDGGMRVRYLPVVVTDTGVRLADAEEKERLLGALGRRSAVLQDEDRWLAEWEAFCCSMPCYVDAVANAFKDVPAGEKCNQVFPHYLDCEAHTDVWHTVFPSWHGDGTSGA
ncbi:MAG: CapA family protein [Clostridia bacterium]|nr:CapA family protein [Clostridia bacterium]